MNLWPGAPPSPPGEGAPAGYSVGVTGSTGVQVGDGNTQNITNNFYSGDGPLPAAQSVYLRQVEQMFPYALSGRSAELAELESFCKGDGGAPYAWWQGPAWAGKSALMAWFVLHPPAGVRVVPFFITARVAGQSDRAAFLEVMLEQLAEAAGLPLPGAVTESNRQGWFLRLLDAAAAACAGRGQRLALVVDGLDEDLGVTNRPDAHSIAALLPALPPPGVRIILSGRPDPPVPADVPPGHPLRHAGIVRPLSVSPHAQMVREDAERELDRLLDDQGAARDLLGLITAARGGLSCDDLAELSGEPPRTVERALQSVLGRTFRGTQNRWRQGEPPVFVLAHEDLQQRAERGFGRGQLPGFADRLHAWADSYREQGWPAQTPEYLLRGYHRLAVAAGDAETMTALATDRARLDRMLDISGGDAAALAEISAARDFIAAQPRPDPAALLALAVTRDQIARRNRSIPPDLPAVWAGLGHPVRAEALARSIPEPHTRATTLASLAAAVSSDRGRALRLAELAEAAARPVADRSKRETALTDVAVSLAGLGYHERAEAIIRDGVTGAFGQAQVLASVAQALARDEQDGRARQAAREAEAAARRVPDPIHRWWALSTAAEALAAAGDPAGAARIARSIADQSWKARAVAKIAEVLAGQGQDAAARRAAAEADADAGLVDDPALRAIALAGVAPALHAVGDTGRALELTGQARDAASGVRDPAWQSSAMGSVAKAFATLGDADQAEAAAGAVAYPMMRNRALAAVAAAIAHVDGGERALELARRIEKDARNDADPTWPANLLTAAARSLARAGAPAEAEKAARSVAEPARRAMALADVAIALADAGDTATARRLAGEAEDSARRAPASWWQGAGLTAAAMALARTGEAGRAEAIARSVDPQPASGAVPDDAGEALAKVAGMLARAGDPGRARALADSIGDPASQARSLIQISLALAQTSDARGARATASRAETVARSVADPAWQAKLLAGAALALAEAGSTTDAIELAGQARAAAAALQDEMARLREGLAAAKSLARAGDTDQAEAAARALNGPHSQQHALAEVAAAAARAGDFARAEQITRSVTSPVWRGLALAALAAALAAKPGTLEPQTGRADPADGGIVPARIADNPAGAKLRELLTAALDEAPPDYDGILPVLTRLAPAAVIRAARDCSTG